MLYQISNKKGVNVIVGYILLVSFVIAMGIIVYATMKTYVPYELSSCPEGTAILLKEYECDNQWLNITIKNNGRFGIGGFFIYVSNVSANEFPSLDLSSYMYEGGIIVGNSIVFNTGSENSVSPETDKQISFELLDNGFEGSLEHISLVAVRFQEDDHEVTQFVSCGDTAIKQSVVCPLIEPPEVLPD